MTRALYRAFEIASPKCQPKRRLRVRRQSECNARRNTEVMVQKRTEQRTKSIPGVIYRSIFFKYFYSSISNRFFKFLRKIVLSVARPSEELWCDCRGPYTGAMMIQCDNDNCPIQWYHAACLNEMVDVSKDWLCEKCRPILF